MAWMTTHLLARRQSRFDAAVNFLVWEFSRLHVEALELTCCFQLHTICTPTSGGRQRRRAGWAGGRSDRTAAGGLQPEVHEEV